MTHTQDTQRYHVRKSLHHGPRSLKRDPIVRFRKRMKPKSWSPAFWFRSGLYDRGAVIRKRAFYTLIQRFVRVGLDERGEVA